MAHVIKTSFQGNPNVGLYGFCAGEYCLLGERLTKQAAAEIGDALQAKLEQFTIAGTTMPGVFLAGNQHALLVPSIAFAQEIKKLQELGFTVKVLETRLTCLGNNIVANEHGALVNPEYTDAEIEEIGKHLKVPVKRIQIAELDTPGACVVLNGKQGIIHRDAAAHEIEMVKATLQLESLEPASVNLGSPYVHAGILNNEHGFLIGDASGGPEIVHVDQVLGYMQ